MKDFWACYKRIFPAEEEGNVRSTLLDATHLSNLGLVSRFSTFAVFRWARSFPGTLHCLCCCTFSLLRQNFLSRHRCFIISCFWLQHKAEVLETFSKCNNAHFIHWNIVLYTYLKASSFLILTLIYFVWSSFNFKQFFPLFFFHHVICIKMICRVQMSINIMS